MEISVPVRSRAAAICAASLITTGLVFGGGIAVAADKPIRGTAACTQLVDANANVQTAEDNVDAAKEELARRINGNDTTANINAQVAAVTRAQNQLAIVRGNTTALLCQDAPAEAPATTTPPVTSDPAPAQDPAPASNLAEVRALIDQLACDDDFNSDRDRIADLRTEAGNGISSEQQAALTDRLNAKLRSLGFCFPAAEPADPQPTTTQAPPTTVNVNGNVTVNPTQDDGSTAATDGSQIEVTPEGSVSTGAA